MVKEFFIWNKDYSVDIKEIDDQHKKLVHLINKLYTAFTDKQAIEVMGEILDEMSEYAKYHFHTEEKYFDQFNFELKEEHKLQHNEFAKKIIEFRRDFRAKRTALTYKLMNFLRNWLIDHIQYEDRKYIKCFKENGVG